LLPLILLEYSPLWHAELLLTELEL